MSAGPWIVLAITVAVVAWVFISIRIDALDAVRRHTEREREFAEYRKKTAESRLIDALERSWERNR